MISQRELQRRIKHLEYSRRRQSRVFVYSARDGDLDAERTAIIQRRCKEEFGYNDRNGDIFIELIAFNFDEDDQIDQNFKHDFILKIDNIEYNDGWPFEH